MYRHHEKAKRRTALSGAAVLCGSQVLTFVLPGDVQAPVKLASADGVFLPIYGLTWFLGMVLCLAYLKSGKLVTPMAFLVGLCAAWGAVWGLSWAIEPGTLWWKTSLVYVSFGVVAAALVGLTPATPKKSKEAGPPLDGGQR